MKTTKSLQKLEKSLDNYSLDNIKGISLKKLGVKVTTDVLKYIEDHPRLELKKVGIGLDKEPIYDTFISIVEEKKICVLCGNEYTGYGNIAQPIKDGECCDSCNDKVILARIDQENFKCESKTPWEENESN